jgi:septum formation protein
MALLSALGIPLEVRPAHIDETLQPGETPEEHVLRLARGKAAAVAAKLPGRVVLGADTAVVLDGAVFGKPADRRDAARMLGLLQGRTHQVLTGWWVVPGRGEGGGGVERSLVTMRPLDREAIEAYVARGESDDKAGGYAAQGEGDGLVRHIEGSWSNVVGLPLPPVAARLRQLGLGPSGVD